MKYLTAIRQLYMCSYTYIKSFKDEVRTCWFYVIDVRFIENSTNLFDICKTLIFTQLHSEVVAIGKL